ncbi:MAG: hypothetical protein J2P47_11925 [Acetobacteraceae bacterium]|nr:hypothetical protein [Acetobacteraceae bacterium]
MTPAISRRFVVPLLFGFTLTACGGRGEIAQEREEGFAPLRYDYLTPIRLNVAAIDVRQRYSPAGADLSGRAPISPAAAIQQMAHDRLQALGTSGRAVLAINDASIVRRGDTYQGSLAIELDIYTSADTRTAFAEARVSGRRSINGAETERRALYELTKQLMDQLNVEFEFQVRRALRSWVLDAPAPPPEPVGEQALPPPVSTPPVPRAR